MEHRRTPDHQQGPRPLALHIAMMTAFSTSSLAGLPHLRNASAFWKNNCQKRESDLADQLEGVENIDFVREVERECRARHHKFAQGVQRYRSFVRPYREPTYTVVWQTGTTCVRDYGSENENAPAILIVPSLVNRADVLDLGCGRSFVDGLRRQGLRPLLVDWGAPGEDEQDFNLTAYITQRLEPALGNAVDINQGRPILLAGYCMGGDLALALALRRQADISGLALLATPWDFHAGDTSQIDMLEASMPALRQTLESIGNMPVDLLQAMFTGLDPWLTPNKFIRFGQMDPESFDAQLFVALEDWLNDGVPLVHDVAIECLAGWYVDNTPASGRWTIGDRIVDPGELNLPAIAFVPGRDHIVPPNSAKALAEAIPGCETRVVPAGHIGMVTGSRAKEVLIEPLATWIQGISVT